MNKYLVIAIFIKDDMIQKQIDNILQLENGQFAAQPNNRIIWRDSSLTPDKLMTPDFKVCTQNYRVETEPKWTVGHTDEWAYKTREEEDIDNNYD